MDWRPARYARALRPQWRAVLVHGNPAELVELKEVTPPGYQSRIRQRTLSPHEIRELWTVCRELEVRYAGSKTSDALRVRYGQRLSAPSGCAWRPDVASASS